MVWSIWAYRKFRERIYLYGLPLSPEPIAVKKKSLVSSVFLVAQKIFSFELFMPDKPTRSKMNLKSL